MEFFNTAYNLKVTPLGLLFVLISVVFFSFFVYLVVRQIRKNRVKVKTGFLGKPLYQLSLVVVILSMLIGVYYLNTTDTAIISEAEKEVKINIDYKTVGTEDKYKSVQFSVIPTVEGKEWGEVDVFDIFWNIRPNDETQLKGQKSISHFEGAKTSENPSGFVTSLIPGKYKLRIIIILDENSYERTEDIVID